MFFKKNCTVKKNSERQDYRIYRLSEKEILRYGGIGLLIGSLFFYFFYDTWMAVPMGIPCSIFYCRRVQKRLCRERQGRLERQFRDWLSGAAGHLQTGYSVENAFLKAGRELKLLYGGDAEIRGEVSNMEHLLQNNVSLENILSDLAVRSGAEAICGFADVFVTGRRSGGSLRDMITNSCDIIVMKIDMEREIRLLLHGRILEQKIMCLMPFGIICYIKISSPGYFAPLYHNPAGVCLMTICLLVYLISVGMSLRIIQIEV